MEIIDHYINQAKAKRDCGALKSSQLEFLRENSIKKLEEMSIPNRRIENWKYTNLKTKELNEDLPFASYSNFNVLSLWGFS